MRPYLAALFFFFCHHVTATDDQLSQHGYQPGGNLTDNAGCICYLFDNGDNKHTLISPFDITWTECSEQYSERCEGHLTNNNSCIVYAEIPIYQQEYIRSVEIGCKSDAFNVIFYAHPSDDGYYSYNFCQSSHSRLLPNDNGCFIQSGFHYNNIGIPIYFDLSLWDISWNFCQNAGQYKNYNYGEALITSLEDNITCIMPSTGGDFNSLLCPYNSCSGDTVPKYACAWYLGNNEYPHDPIENFCLPYKFLNDNSCGNPYFVCNNFSWFGCKNTEGYGNCTNPLLNDEICTIKNYNKEQGEIDCNACSVSWDLTEHDRFSTDPSCVQAINDGSCAIPDQFKCKGMLWDICVEHNGTAKCTHDETGCHVYISSRCLVPDVVSCGKINCDDGCHASWNQPGKPAIYEFPQGCMSNPAPDPSPNSSSDNNLIIPLSVTGCVIAVGTVSTVFGLVACLVYSHHKRQGYQTVQ